MRRLHWGILGTAKIAVTKVIPAMATVGNCEVVAIASRDGAKAAEAAEALHLPRSYASYEDLLADDELDAIYVPLPNHLHARWAIAAAEAGKHVLCEKPLALDEASAQDIVAAAAAADVHLMEAFMYRLHPSWQELHRLVLDGRIGQLKAVHSWFAYYNDDPANIRNMEEAGGGALLDVGCYSINLSRWLFDAEPDEVTATMVKDAELGVDTTTSALLRFGDGLASFTCSTRMKADQHVTAYGTEGAIRLEVPFNIRSDRPARLVVSTGKELPPYGTPEVIELPGVDPYAVLAERFAAAVLEDTAVPVPPRDAVQNMAVLQRVIDAAALGTAGTR